MDAGIAALAALDGVLEDPAPTSLILDIPGSGARFQFMGWIDQRRNDVRWTRSEALRHVANALQRSGNAAGEPVQRIRLERGETAAQRPDDYNGSDRDTSVDHGLDEQIGEARREEPASDLLQQPSASNETSPRNSLASPYRRSMRASVQSRGSGTVYQPMPGFGLMAEHPDLDTSLHAQDLAKLGTLDVVAQFDKGNSQVRGTR